MTYRHTPQLRWNFGELVVDNFAGGGGASTGIEMALGRPVDIAINHDPLAISMHTVNHPSTQHYLDNVWQVDPREVSQGRPVGLAWFSPDCTHHSKARGGKPVSPRVRGLAWVVLKWAGLVRPRVIMLENVEEFENWGPLTRSRRPCPQRKGMIFEKFVSQLRDLGYSVEWRQLRACDYGAPTIRKRLFLIARRDGQPIVWPEPTHGPGLKPYRAAADIIDWSIPCPSIFERSKPLAEKTLARIARGIQRFVIDNPKPFVVPAGAAPFLTEHANASTQRVFSAEEPLRTQVASIKGGHFALVAPYIQPYYGDKSPIARGATLNEPLRTQTTENRFSLCCAFLAKHYGGGYKHGVSGLGEWWEPGDNPKGPPRRGVDWVIVGGESGPKARPMHLEWVRSLRDQCQAADTPVFFKQWGEWGPNWYNDNSGNTIAGSEWMDRMGKKLAGRLLDDRTWDQFPSQ